MYQTVLKTAPSLICQVLSATIWIQDDRLSYKSISRWDLYWAVNQILSKSVSFFKSWTWDRLKRQLKRKMSYQLAEPGIVLKWVICVHIHSIDKYLLSMYSMPELGYKF